VYAKNALLRVWAQQKMQAFHDDMTRKAADAAAGRAGVAGGDTLVGFGV
jgi:hypothetical protein